MSDQDIINGAYEDAVKKLFDVFFQSFVDANGKESDIDTAKQEFKAGLAAARTARDTAIGLL